MKKNIFANLCLVSCIVLELLNYTWLSKLFILDIKENLLGRHNNQKLLKLGNHILNHHYTSNFSRSIDITCIDIVRL